MLGVGTVRLPFVSSLSFPHRQELTARQGSFTVARGFGLPIQRASYGGSCYGPDRALRSGHRPSQRPSCIPPWSLAHVPSLPPPCPPSSLRRHNYPERGTLGCILHIHRNLPMGPHPSQENNPCHGPPLQLVYPDYPPPRRGAHRSPLPISQPALMEDGGDRERLWPQGSAAFAVSQSLYSIMLRAIWRSNPGPRTIKHLIRQRSGFSGTSLGVHRYL